MWARRCCWGASEAAGAVCPSAHTGPRGGTATYSGTPSPLQGRERPWAGRDCLQALWVLKGLCGGGLKWGGYQRALPWLGWECARLPAGMTTPSASGGFAPGAGAAPSPCPGVGGACFCRPVPSAVTLSPGLAWPGLLRGGAAL